MGANPKDELLARIALREELIATSKKMIEDSKNLVKQSHRLISIAMGHDVDGEGNATTRRNEKTARTYSSVL